ncbi:MAG: hypothetical protein QGD94_08900, partial [Planctomycetia bacterium]|nr:hypothetical protein [Planctomycetia bacterium]
IYIPWLPGALFYRQGHTNTTEFIADLLENVAGFEPVGGNLSPMVEVTLYERDDGSCQVLHLVNTSGHFGTTFFEPVTMTDVEVTVPCQREPKTVVGLVAKEPCDISWHAGRLTVRLARLAAFEAIRIE